MRRRNRHRWLRRASALRRMLSGLSRLKRALLRLRLSLMQKRHEARQEGSDHFRFPNTSRVA
jgi:hypothetical protein